MRIFSMTGCPFAHRSRALLTLLSVPFELREIDPTNKPADFQALSPTGKVPLIDDGGFVLYESQVINEYLAERFSWKDAFAPEIQQRARERLAMKQFDETVVPIFFKALKDPAAAEASPSWEREVESIGATVTDSKVESLLGLHVATHWLRMNWVAPDSKVVTALRKAAGGFLDAATSLPAVQVTAPDRAITTRVILKRFGPQAA